MDRKPLPIKVADQVNVEVLRAYRAAVLEVSKNLKTLLMEQSGVSVEEAVLQNLEKSINSEGGMVFESGQKVMVDVQGQWVPAMVKSYQTGVLKVEREDGAVRVVSDPLKVRAVGTTSENFPESGIWIQRFGVRIPQGTQSYKMEKALDPITERMNVTPLRVNKETYLRNLKKVAVELEEANAVCRELSGNPAFRPNSPKDCVAEFQEKRGLPLGKKGSTGTPSVDKDVLQNLVNLGDPLAPKVMHARELQSHYSQLQKWAPFAEAGSVQTVWDQYGQPHGRYTSEEPNLQNRVLEIRETVEPKEGFTFLSVDWGMAEYVTWASLSKDAYLSNIFKEGRDLHQEMGSDLVKLNPTRDLGSDSVRKFGKTSNFAILYRMLPYTLAKSLGVSNQEAEALMKSYHDKAPEASTYSDKVLAKAAQQGFVETAFGRRLYCQGLATLKGGALHQLQKTVWHHHNAGTAAEMLKFKMVELNSVLANEGFTPDQVHVAMNMHDEIIYEVADSVLAKVTPIVYGVMSEKMEGFLPFKVDMRTGKNWLAISK